MSIKSQTAIAALDAIPSADSFADDEVGRLSVVAAAKKLLARIQTPSEQAWAYVFDFPVIFPSIQTLRDLGIWDAWAESGAEEKTLDELLKLANTTIETDVLRRLMRLLTAANIVDEDGQDKYKSTPYSTYLGGKFGAVIQYGTETTLPMAAAFPGYLKETGYTEAKDPKHCAYSNIASNPDHLDFWSRCQADPTGGIYASFSSLMEDWTARKPDWTEWYDLNSLLESSDLAQGPFLVDMGGHYGVDITRVLRRHPELPEGSLVLQDLPEVIQISKTKVDGKIKTMEFDLFKPQTVFNSRIYYIHAVIHNWADSKVLAIFENLRPAMKKGYSKLLIHDMVLPSTGASLVQAVMDVEMMGIVGAKERTQAAWTDLLIKGGFTDIKFHQDGHGIECIIESDIV